MAYDYEADEWYEEYEPECMYYNARLCKAANGHLYVEEVTAWAYAEREEYDSYYWHWVTERLPMKAFTDSRPLLIEAGKTLKPGESVELDDVLPNDDEDDWDEDDASTVTAPPTPSPTNESAVLQ